MVVKIEFRIVVLMILNMFFDRSIMNRIILIMELNLIWLVVS